MIKALRIRFKTCAPYLHRPWSNIFQPNSLLLRHHSTGLSLKAPFSSPLCSWLKLPLPDARGSSCIAPSPNPNPNPVRSLKMIPENTHLNKTGKLANRHISSIARIPGRAVALVPVLKGGLSTDQRSGHSADHHWGNPQPQASALTVSKFQALEMSDAGVQGTDQTSSPRALAPACGPHPPPLPACPQRTHFSPRCLWFPCLFKPTEPLTLQTLNTLSLH